MVEFSVVIREHQRYPGVRVFLFVMQGTGELHAVIRSASTITWKPRASAKAEEQSQTEVLSYRDASERSCLSNESKRRPHRDYLAFTRAGRVDPSYRKPTTFFCSFLGGGYTL